MQRDFKGVWIPKEIWLNDNLGWTEKILLVEIDSLAKNGDCFATNEYFSQFMKLSKDRISKLITSLSRKNLIKVDLIYKENSKEIDKRIITVITGETPPQDPIGENADTPRRKHLDPLGENADTPIGENAYYNNTKIFNNTINNTTNKRDINNMLKEEFERLWSIYPRKQGKAKAYKSYIKARKNALYETIEKGLYQYIKYINANTIQPEYIKHGSTWFAQESWLDELENELRPTMIKKERQGFLGLLMDQEEIQGGLFFEQRGNNQNISDYTDFIPQPLQDF